MKSLGQMLALSARWNRGSRPRCRVTMITPAVRCTLIAPPATITIGPVLALLVFNNRQVAANG